MIQSLVLLFYLSFKVDCFVYDNVDYNSRDLLSAVNSTGKSVVEAAITKMEQTIGDLPFDYSLTYRIALVESNFGTDSAVMDSNSVGGIWQITQEVFEELRDNANNDYFTSIFLDKIKQLFNFDCFLCNYNFSTPIKSVLAFRLYLEYKQGAAIPTSLFDQAKWWSEKYHLGGNEDDFKQKVDDDESDYQLYDKTDMWFICDASDSVSDEDFDYSINFTCSMASQCSIGKTETQCGLSTYYHDHEIEYEFENTTNYEDFETAAQSIEKQDSNRKCGAALTLVAEGFDETEASRSQTTTEEPITTTQGATTQGVTAAASVSTVVQIITASSETNEIKKKKNIFLITDKESKDDVEEPTKKLKENNITLFNLAVGSALNRNKVGKITEQFGGHFTYYLSKFMDLGDEETQNDIFDSYCSALAYSEEDVDYICVVICITFVEENLNIQNKSKDEIQKEMESIFHVDCQACKDYSADEISAISTAFQTAIVLGESSEVIDMIQKLQAGNSGGTAVTEQATTQAANSESLCGEDFNSDVWFLLDGSASINESEFSLVQDFTATMASRFDIGGGHVQLGLSVFAENYEVVYDLNQPTNLESFKVAADTATQPPFFKNFGKAIKSTLEIAFSASNGARVDESVKRNLVVLIEGNETDDVSSIKQLVEEKNVTLFVVGIGENVNKSMINSLASEPVNKHALFLPDFKHLDPSVSRDILKTVEKTSRPLKKNRALRMAGRPGSNREVTTSINKNEDLIMKVETTDSTAGIVVYIKVGNGTASSALYDAMFQLTNGGGDVVLKAEKLLEKYPSISGDEVRLSISISVDKQTEIDVSFEDDVRSDLQKATDMLDQLLQECETPNNLLDCIEKLKNAISEGKIQNAPSDLIQSAENLLSKLSKDYVEQNLENLVEVCNGTAANQTLCVTELAKNIKNGVSLGMENSKLQEGKDLLKKLLTQEINEITAECESASDQSACYSKLEENLKLAEEMNITNSIVEESKAALTEFQKSDQGSADFQTNNSSVGIALAVVAVAAVASLLLFALYKKKKKEQVQPLSELEELQLNIKTLTNEASQPNATYSCMEELRQLHSIAEQWELDDEDIVHSREILQTLEIRIEKIKSDLHSAAEDAHESDFSAEALKNLQEQIAIAKQLQFPEEELTVSNEALCVMKSHLISENNSSQYIENEVKSVVSGKEPEDEAAALPEPDKSDAASANLVNQEKTSLSASHEITSVKEDNVINSEKTEPEADGVVNSTSSDVAVSTQQNE